MKPDQTYWVVQKALIKKGDKVLVLNDPDEGLDFPGGKIQEGEEDLKTALKREVREETGLVVEVGTPFVVWQSVFPRSHKHAGKKVYSVGFKCTHVSGDVRLSEEHDRYRWIDKGNYREVDDGTSFFEILDTYFS